MIDPQRPDFQSTPVAPDRPRFHYAAADPAAAAAAPAVSVITPFFNTGEIFHETAASLLAQSFQQWEWLIVNDGSTDPIARTVLDCYRGRDPRVRVIDLPENCGPGAARNHGFAAARTQFIFQLDSDNLIEPTAIEKCFWYLLSYPTAAFVKGCTVGFGAHEYLWTRGFHDGALFLDQNQVDATSMIRKSVIDAVEGYDASIRAGFEDWDFWLRCADHGFWGATIHEFMDWYRRRPSHNDRWADWDEGARQYAFRRALRSRYPRLWENGFPAVDPMWHGELETVPDDIPCRNRLEKRGPRLLVVAPWFAMGGADKFNLDLASELRKSGWEITFATTLSDEAAWLPRFARETPDLFRLPSFLRLPDYPRFLRYLIESRDVDAVLITNSELGYLLLPYLRAVTSRVPFLDYCHIEEEYWRNGGYPRLAIQYQEQLDLNVVSSARLKSWMTERGAEADRIRVCHTNIDTRQWRRDEVRRAAVRAELGLAQDARVILFAGRICSQKQPGVLARTLHELRRRGAVFHALIAGDGPDLPWLRSFLTGHRLENVTLLGALPNDRVRDLMSAADIFFLPSAWEGIALTLFEAMACSLAVVTADVGGQRELVSRGCGFLIERGRQDEEVARYVDVLARLLADPEQCRAVGDAARLRIEQSFELEHMRDRMTSLIAEAGHLVANDPRPRPTLGLGRAAATQAIEYVRLHRVAGQLWAERTGTAWGTRVHRQLVHWLKPTYRWGVARGWKWLVPLGERIRKTLLHLP